MADDIITESNSIDANIIEESSEFDFTFKIIVVGDFNVGKTSLIQKYINNTFSDKYKATIGLDIFLKTIRYQNKVIQLQLWDTGI